MNKTVTSREELLRASYEIILVEGSGKLNIRSLAKKCNISIGSVYNYFPSKSELLLAVSEEFWRKIFYPSMHKLQKCDHFLEVFKNIYNELCKHLPVFRSMILTQYKDMNSSVIDQGRKIERDYLSHIKAELLKILSKDPSVSDNIWSIDFTPSQFIDFLFQIMFVQLTQGITDCTYLLEIIRRILYLNTT